MNMTERYTFSDAANAEDAFVRLRRWIAERSKMSVLSPGVWRVSVTGIVGNSAEAAGLRKRIERLTGLAPLDTVRARRLKR